MKMWRIEKVFVNRGAKGRWNVRALRRRLRAFDMTGVRDVLEIGCGRGDVAAFLAKHHDVRVRGVDVDPEQVALARRKHSPSDRLIFTVGDAEALDLPAGSFDLVVAHHTFHHLPGWKCAASEMARVLRPGGRALWLDLAVPRALRGIVARIARGAGVFTFPDVSHAFRACGLETRAHALVWTGPLPHHDIVLWKPDLSGREAVSPHIEAKSGGEATIGGGSPDTAAVT